MTRSEHTAWYSLIIANIYAAADKDGAFIAFLVLSFFFLVDSFLERKP